MREDGHCWLEVLGRRVPYSHSRSSDETGFDKRWTARVTVIILYIQSLALKIRDYENVDGWSFPYQSRRSLAEGTGRLFL